MSKPLIKIHNVLTNEIVEREMNDDEYFVWQKDQAESATRQAEQDAKAAAKESALTKLQALGLSEAEAKQIVGI
jgi:hypothetical protein